MKILRISLRNIASLAGDHTVDFTRSPLANAGLFSISGPTGSGKSTLLDALCLALYDETPRLAVVAGAAAVTDAGQTVQQDDVRNLLRRGCGEGYAEVAFVGVDGCTYTASWVVRRARQRSSGALQQTQMNLFKGNVLHETDRQVAFSGTRTQVLKEIEARVGLSFAQFRRAVLLAQGDFATFLKAKDNERAEILQALTGTERFERISTAVYERHKREEELVLGLRNQIGTLLPLSPEERTQAEEAWKEAAAVRTRVEKEHSARHKQLEWFSNREKHQDSLRDASARVSALGRLVEEDRPRARRIQWIRTASLEAGPLLTREKTAAGLLATASGRATTLETERTGLEQAAETAKGAHAGRVEEHRKLEERKRGMADDIAKARVLDGELTQLQDTVSTAHTEQQRARQASVKAAEALARLEAGLVESEKVRTKLTQRISDVARFAPFAAEMDGWSERFGAEKKTREKKEGLERKLKTATEAVDAAAKRLEAAALRVPGLRQEADLAEADWREAAQNAAAFDSTDILTRRRGAQELRDALQELRSHLEARKRCVEEQRGCAESIEDLGKKITGEDQKRSELRGTLLPSAEKALTQARDSLRLAEAAASEHALVLRQALLPGEGCPVCGALEHPLADAPNSPQKAVFKALRGDVAEKEKTLVKMQAELSRADALFDQFGKQRRELQSTLDNLGKRVAKFDEYKPSLPEAAALLAQPEAQREANLATREAETAKLLGVLEGMDAKRIEAEQKQKLARDAFEEKAGRLKSGVSAEEQEGRACESARSDRSRIAEELEFAAREYREAFAKVSPVLEALVETDGADRAGRQNKGRLLTPDYSREPEAFLAWFKEGAGEWSAATRALDEATRGEEAARGQLEPLREAAQNARKELDARTGAADAAGRGFAAKTRDRKALFEGRAVTEVEAEIASELDTALAAVEGARKEAMAANERLGANAQLLAAQREQIAAQQTELRNVGGTLDAWLQEFGRREERETNRADLEDWLGRDAEWLGREEAELNGRVKELSSAKGVEATMQTQLDNHLRTRETEEEKETVAAEAARLAQDLEDAKGLEDARKLAVLADDRNRREAGKLTETLRKQEKVWEPWQKLNALIGSRDGAKFRTIAQQWTLEILLRHANAQLQMLSGRYRLERLRDSLNLLVTDLDMDGQQRSVHSLSGGESFLVSLGLALGLASLTSSRLRIESLFIDEGFGSLDSETLRVALNALNSLEAQGRKVGVISHVSEMVDAIPAQVRVVRSQGGASKIVV
jgi:exonuclease SbcC